MSYNKRLIGEEIFPEEIDKIVKHKNGDLYLSLNNELFIPLRVEDEELYVDKLKTILNKSTADPAEIDQFKKLISDMAKISVQEDIPEDVEDMDVIDPEPTPEQSPEPEQEFDPLGLLDGDDDGNLAEFEFVNGPDLVPETDGGFGTGDVVEVMDTTEDLARQVEEDLDEVDEIVFHEMVDIQTHVYKTHDPTNITDLIKERHQIVDNAALTKYKHLVESLVANHIKSRDYSPGRHVLQNGIPSWIVPIVCSELVLQGDPQRQEAVFHNKEGGCETEFDIPYSLSTRVDRMITDKMDEAPGNWFQVRRDYGVNMVQHTEGPCRLTENMKLTVKRQPVTEYKHKINLDPKLLHTIEAKKIKERERREQQATRTRCGLAYAHAITEPGAVRSITITRQSRTINNVLGLAVYDPNNISGKPQIVPIKCKDGQDFVSVLDSIIKSILDDMLNEDTFERCHNLRPIDRMLKTVNMSLHNLTPNHYKKINEILTKNHPFINYAYCEKCNKYESISDDAETDSTTGTKVCPTCNETTAIAQWSSLNRQYMIKSRSAEQKVNMHPTRASIDYGRMYYLEQLFNYIDRNQEKVIPVEPSTGPKVNGVKLIRPRSIQIYEGKFYYKKGDQHYVKSDYDQLVGQEAHKLLHDSVESYPKIEWVSQQRKLLQIAYKHRETQIEIANRRLLSGLVIDIIKDVPEAGLVVKYMNRLLETDNESIYLSMLDQFQDIGIITYDEHNGRYMVSDTSDMIICICHKTYLDEGQFNGSEFFNNNGRCRYCRTILNYDEQILDPTNLTGRDLIAGDQEVVEDDTYIGLETLLSTVIEHINEVVAGYGWIITSSEKDTILDSLKTETEIDLSPYGKEMATSVVEFDSGDLRSFVQLQGQKPIYVKTKKGLGYRLNKDFKYGNAEGKINFRRLIGRYLSNTLGGDTALINSMLAPDSGSDREKELNRVLHEMSAAKEGDKSKDNIIKNEGLLIAFFNLPIIKAQAKNITVILGYLSSFLEIKYGTKTRVGDKTVYLTSDQSDISEMIKHEFTMEFIHDILGKFTGLMYNKYSMTLAMMQQMSREKQGRMVYFRRMMEMYNHIMTNGQSSFNPKFTLYFEELLRSKKNVTYVEERKRHVSIVVAGLRKSQASIYDLKKEGEKPMVRERRVAMWYDIAPQGIVGYAKDQVNSIQELVECQESAKQRTYTKYLEELRTGYRKASDKAKEITHITDVAESSGESLDILTTTAYLTQGEKFLNEPKEDKEMPDWKREMSKAKLTYTLSDMVEPEPEVCTFMDKGYQDIVLRQQMMVDAPFHTVTIPIHPGQYNLGKLVDRSSIPEPVIVSNSIHKKLLNLQKSYDKELEQQNIGGLFSNGGDLISDELGDSRQNYVSGTLPIKSKHSIETLHNEQAKKAREMQRVVDRLTGHAEIPDFLRSDEDPDEFKPWGPWDDPSHKIDLTIRRVRRSQNVGMSLVKILRWLGTAMTEQEMDIMGQYIQRSRAGNIIGADGEFKIERDQIDAMGYVLKDLYDIKIKLMKSQDSDEFKNMKLAEYESHFTEFYQMSYDNYRTLARKLHDPASGPAWDDKYQMLNLVSLAIKVDIIKHIQYIGIHGQSVKDPEAQIDMEKITINHDHKPFLKVVAEVLDALIKNGGPDIIDPNRSDIDWRYEERFMEYAGKKKLTTARTVKDKAGLNINTPYAGMQATGEIPDIFPDVDDEYDPMKAAELDEQMNAPDDNFDPMAMATPDGYNEPLPIGEDEVPDDEELDGLENEFQGEDFDPMDLL